MKTIYVESFGGNPYITTKDLEDYHKMSKSTVYDRINEMEAQIGKRYPAEVIIGSGKNRRINNLAFTDWISVREQLQDESGKKYVKAFDPAKWARLMGWSNRVTVMED